MAPHSPHNPVRFRSIRESSMARIKYTSSSSTRLLPDAIDAVLLDEASLRTVRSNKVNLQFGHWPWLFTHGTMHSS